MLAMMELEMHFLCEAERKLTLISVSSTRISDFRLLDLLLFSYSIGPGIHINPKP